MNLEMKIHPAIVVIVVALTAIAIATKFWADGQALSYSGPSQLLSDPQGRVYIQIQNQLLEHSAEGDFLRRHDLGELDVDTVIGSLAFFSDGDLLLRRGADKRSLGNKIAAYQRRTNTSDLEPEAPGAGLVRCNLETRTCRPFADPPIDIKSTFGADIDWRSDEVYISDTSRHTLRKYSRDGVELADPVDGFKFPNQLLLHDRHLFVADTNNHQIRIVDPASESFAQTIQSQQVAAQAGHAFGHRWPSQFARIGDEWWVNNMNNAMRNGGIYAFDEQWEYLRRIPLPEHADPVSILPFAGGALISDWDNDRVYRVSAAGTLLDDFESAGLEAVLAESRERRFFYSALSWMGIVLLAAVMLALIMKAIMSPARKAVAQRSDNARANNQFDDALIWFEPDPKVVRNVRRSLKFGGIALLALVLLTVYVVVRFGNLQVAAEIGSLIGGIVLVFAVIHWITRGALATAIGFEAGDLILRNHKGRESRCPVSAVMYNEVAIATADMAVLLGNHKSWLYDQTTVREQILPRLEAAQAIPPPQMRRLLMRLQRPQGLALMLVIVGLAAVAALHLLR